VVAHRRGDQSREEPDSGVPAFDENTQQVLYLDSAIAPKPMPNMLQLQALNDYYSWRRAEARKR
jgi:hypothetical protein